MGQKPEKMMSKEERQARNKKRMARLRTMSDKTKQMRAAMEGEDTISMRSFVEEAAELAETTSEEYNEGITAEEIGENIETGKEEYNEL